MRQTKQMLEALRLRFETRKLLVISPFLNLNYPILVLSLPKPANFAATFHTSKPLREARDFLRIAYSSIYALLISKFEVCQSKISFMSEEAVYYLGSIGLLGEYCPTSRKKSRDFFERVDCMHLWSFHTELYDCSRAQGSLVLEDQSWCVEKSLEDTYILKSCSSFL
ncbi:unnamed protein product [Coffea canephora]|uniref:Uncharacterized protein n=1 Tax=Coffea canephora TaxID=49390 RepID=A0A068U2H1_COFCA|nr:unnamed protein product [Coffea canephora]